MGEKKIILIVNGYGCHLDTPLGRIYLPKVVKYIKENYEQIGAVIFSGGYTQKKTARDISEALLMANYVKAKLGDIRLPVYRMQEVAYTSYDNTFYAALGIEDIRNILGVDPQAKDIRIVHFCEAQRAPLVDMLDRHFLIRFVESIDDITIETASWERADPYRQVRNMIYNKLAIKYPWLGLAEREHRIRLERSKHI
ncbi:MAG TPA: hypothetical protein VFK07_00610 [Candidatus Paceibacterota bacterium]|nr:hypothetical protein [Candidatus Paceibacterota bacterium]